jgi:hypothetical protein
MGDTHRQAKTKDHDKECQRKKQKWLLASYDETPSPEGSPKYQEFNLSSSTTESNDDGDGGDQCRIEPSGGGTQFASDKYNLNMLHMRTLFFWNVTNAPSFFLGEADFTHATQDRDHDAPSSQMITMTSDKVGESVGNIT